MVKVSILKLIPSLFHFTCALEAPCLSCLCGGTTIHWSTPVHLRPASLFSDIMSGAGKQHLHSSNQYITAKQGTPPLPLSC